MKLSKFNKNLKKEYNDTFDEKIVINEKKLQKRLFKTKPCFKLRYAFIAIALLLVSIVLIDHAVVASYNNRIDDRMNAVLNLSGNELEKVSSKKDLNSKLDKVDFNKRESFLQSVLSIFEDEKYATNAPTDDMAPSMPDAPTNGTINNSYNTNIQTEGVDEADSAKCDGKYIYAIQNNNLYIYDLDGNLIDNVYTSANELYLYNNMIILVEKNKASIYHYDGEKLLSNNEFPYNTLVESRLLDNNLYLVVMDKLDVDKNNYNNMYYDGCINPYYVFTLIKYDLNTSEAKEIKLVNAYSSILYASNNNFFLASINNINGYCVTFISIVDMNLNPIGVIRLKGDVLNQFSMDEANGYFRVVATDNSKSNDEINSISIYNLATLELTGYLNKGIGKPGQQIKSARFEGDTCYVVTYLTQDPLYEIDCSDPTKPYIADFYESPGYSSYLHDFKINNENYLFGLGYTDLGEIKLSIYHNNDDLTQIGKDLIITYPISYIEKLNYTYQVEELRHNFVSNHKTLFIYNDNTYLYIGAAVGYNQYTIFKVDVTNTDMPVSIYKEFKDVNMEYALARGFLVNNSFYIVITNDIIIEKW